ncbi:MAG TPA: nuclear transport factor 2 family protein, partial [Thermoleophilaceae bacterium]|nr:nuclear transport factor 2 family protein [Thermoleophilaceae bacterium]
PLVAAAAGASRLVYLCPAPTGPFGGVDVGARPSREGFPFPPDREDGTSAWEPDAAVAAMYPRLAPEVGRALAAGLHPGSSAPDPYPLDEHPGVPATLILATDDEFFEPDWSRRVARAALGIDAVEIATGHFPMIEAPRELARVLVTRANLDMIAAGIDAWNRGDLDGWLENLDSDVVFDLPGRFPDFERTYRGRDGAIRFWHQLREPWEEFRIDVEWIEGDGDRIVGAIRFLARGVGSGAEADMRYGQGFRLRAGRVVEMISRATPEEAREALA